jgi:hypothetical protein
MKYDVDEIFKNINEETTSGAVTYIPGGFQNVKKEIRTIAKKKHDWGITIYNDKDMKRVMFEDSLVVNVNTSDWDEFVSDMGLIQEDGKYFLQECRENVIYPDKLNFYNLLECDISEEWNKSVGKVMAGFKGLLFRKGISLFERETDNWIKMFGVVDETAWENSLLSSKTLKEDLDKIEKKIREEYISDLGGLDILAYQLSEGKAELIYKLMDNSDYLLSTHIVSMAKEDNMRFELLMDKNFRLTESVLVGSSAVIMEASGNREFVTGNKLIRPARGLFGESGMQVLKNIVESNLEV